MTHTTEEVIAQVDKQGRSNFVSNLLFKWGNRPEPEIEGIGTAVLVDSKPGEEDGGSDIWVVFTVNGGLYRISGYYNSDDGSDWDDGVFEAVVPKTVTQVIYESA